MAALVVQSRFAGLKIEDEDHPSSSEGQKTKKPKTNTVKKPEPPKKAKNNNTKAQVLQTYDLFINLRKIDVVVVYIPNFTDI